MPTQAELHAQMVVACRARPTKAEATSLIIARYLSVGGRINRNWMEIASEALNYLWRDSAQEIVERHILEMPYYHFLNTPYWRVIAWRVKLAAGFRCSNCNRRRRLEAHHTTYDGHGREVENWQDTVICLCEPCHEAVHSLPQPYPAKPIEKC